MDLNTKDGKTEAQIAEIVGLSIGRVSEIITTFTSEHGGKSATKADKRRKLTEKDRIAISRLILNGEKQTKVAETFSASQAEISKTWGEIRDKVYDLYLGRHDDQHHEPQEDSAFTRGILLNMARRNMAPEQMSEARKHIKKLALALRKTGKSQPEISELLKIPQRTISYWKAGEKGDITITKTGISYIPDCRMIVPRKEHETIYERAKAGETQN